MNDGVGIVSARPLIPEKSGLKARRLVDLFVERGSWVDEAGLKVDGGRSERWRSRKPLANVRLRVGFVTSAPRC